HEEQITQPSATNDEA
nr:RecName: Full=Unknown protein from 2D-PAGE of needles; AltName: Full=N150/N151; AltName: Full=S1247/S1248 [Pinus pinaster]